MGAQTFAKGCNKIFYNNFEDDDINQLHWVDSITGTEVFKIQKLPPKVFLKISQNSKESTYTRVSFLLKNFMKKETPTQVLFCELLKTTFLQATVSQNIKAYI